MNKFRCFYATWFIALAFLLTYYCMTYKKVPYLGAGKTVGVFTFVMLAIYCVGQRFLTNEARRCFPALLAAVAVVLYAVYALYWSNLLRTTTIRDCIVSGTIWCLLGVLDRNSRIGSEKFLHNSEKML